MPNLQPYGLVLGISSDIELSQLSDSIINKNIIFTGFGYRSKLGFLIYTSIKMGGKVQGTYFMLVKGANPFEGITPNFAKACGKLLSRQWFVMH